MELEDIRIIKNVKNKTVSAEILSLNSFIESNFAKIFNKTDSSQNSIDIQFERDLELLNVENVLKILEYFSKREFSLRVESTKSNSFAFYWRVKNIRRVFTLECKSNEDLCEFLREFLIEEIKRGACSVIPGIKVEEHQLINPIDLCLIGDERGFNLLFLAAEAGNAKVVQSLLEDGMNVSCLVDGKIPADIAYEKKHLDVLLCLLKANSRFPRDFEAPQEVPQDLKEFLKMSSDLRNAILANDQEGVKAILKSNKNLRFFYNTNNESILTFALLNKRFKLYKLLLSFHLSFGSREDFDAIADLLDYDEQRKIRQTHLKSSRKVVDKHLMILMANSSVAYDNFETRDKLSLIYEAYEYLNKIPVALPILKVIAARRDFEIHFDFNRESVKFLDPTVSSYTNGLFYLSGRILIGAKGLLDPEERNEVYGVIIHELTHFAMCLVYNNHARPYPADNVEAEENFKVISDCCKSKMECEPIIESVFEDYEEEIHDVELIVRSPQMHAHYNEDQEKLKKSKEDFAPLHEFFEHQVVPDVNAAIPRIENEAAEAYKKALKKISMLQKALWVSFVFFIIFSAALASYFYEPDYSWNNLSSEEQMKVFDSVVNYRGYDIKFKDLLANDSAGFEPLKSSQLKNALNGDIDSLNHALNTNLDQYVFLSPLNLTEGFWDKILSSTVNFQGQNVSLNDTASNTSVLNQLSSKQIKTLLSNEAIDIGTKIEFTSFYIPRKFVEPDNFVLNVSSEVFDYANDSKIFILSDKPGSGKSVSFQAMQKEFKETNPEYWIDFIELKNFYGVFESVQNSTVDIIADKILNLKGLDRDIFIDQFENGKVILLWDGVDEIAPDFDDSFISFAFNIFSSTSNSQLISTRPQYAAKICNAFNSQPQSLVEYTEEDRNDFINGYLDSVEISIKSKRSKVYDQVIDFIDNIQSIESNSLRDDINNPLMLKMLVDIAISNKLSRDLDNIYKVYDAFMKLKLKVVSGKGSIVIGTALIGALDISIYDIHMIHALKYIFGDSFDNYFNNTQIHTDKLWKVDKKNTLDDHQLSSYGVIVKFGNKIDFVHRTFAEFFVAKYLIKNIYEPKSHLQVEDMKMQIALLHNVAFNIYVRKVIQEFILNFLRTQKSDDKKFEGSIIEVMKNHLGNIHNYFVIQERASMFIKFFEKDERVMKILAKVDQYSNINDWLDEVLGISLGDKKSFIENNQLGLILLRSWQFESQGNKIFADFMKKTTKIFDESNRSLEIFSERPGNLSNETGLSNETLIAPDHDYRNITEQYFLLLTAESVSEWLNVATSFLHSKELKQIFINLVHIIDINLVNSNGSLSFINHLNLTLNHEEIVTALTKTNQNNETLFYLTLRIDNEPFNDQILLLIEEHLDDEEILKLFTKPEKNYNSTLLMTAAQFQDRVIFQKLINFTKSHVTEDQFRLILLQRDILNDTILQYSHWFPYDDNFVFIAAIYHEILTKQEIRETFSNRVKNKLPSFGENFKSTSDENSMNVAHFLDYIFTGDDDALLELLSRRNENGDTIFSLHKNLSRLQNKLNAYKILLYVALSTKENKTKIVENLFKTDFKI